MKIKLYDGREIYVDGYLYSNLEALVDTVAQNWDVHIGVGGERGAGKSTFAIGTLAPLWITIALNKGYIKEAKLSNDNIANSAEEAEKLILNSPPFTPVIMDEAILISFSKNSMQQANKRMFMLETMARSQKLFLISIVPNMGDLEKVIVVDYMKVWFDVFAQREGSKLRRGFFKMFNRPKKAMLYEVIKGRLRAKITPNFFGRFANHFHIDEVEYSRRKLLAMRKLSEEKPKVETRHEVELKALMFSLRKEGWTNVKIAQTLSQFSGQKVADTTIGRRLAGFKPASAGDINTTNLQPGQKAVEEEEGAD